MSYEAERHLNDKFWSTVLEERFNYFSSLSIENVAKYHWKRWSKSMQLENVAQIFQRCIAQLINANICFLLNFIIVLVTAF